MNTTHFLTLAVRATVVASLILPAASWARCSDDLALDKPDKGDKGAARAAAKAVPVVKTEAEAPADPMSQLQQIAREAGRRSAAVGAAKLLAEAADLDVAETKAGRWPQVSINGNAGRGGSTVDGTSLVSGRQNTIGVNVGATLWDNGRLSRLTDWRAQMAGSARFGAAVTNEQVVMEAVGAALERNRYRLQAQVYQQFMRKMSCLVEALEGIVAEDKGRTSELIQAKKTQAQTELQRDQALAQSRQIEIKLRKLIGDQVPPGDGITIPLAAVPELGEINRQIETGNDAQQMRAQADAMDSYAKAVVAGQRPQVNWSLGKSEGLQGGSHVGAWHAGVTLNYSIFNGFSDDIAARSALKRAEATRAQLADLLAGKFSRTAEMYDVASSSFDRARRYVDILRDSEKVRNFTFQQWSQLGRRSLFDVMSAESDHFNLRIAYVNALHDGYMANAQLRSLGTGLTAWLAPELLSQ
jgi:adhesin transport system outer membrane protein